MALHATAQKVACLDNVGAEMVLKMFAKVMLAVPAAPLRAAPILIVSWAQLAILLPVSARYKTARDVQAIGSVTRHVISTHTRSQVNLLIQ